MTCTRYTRRCCSRPNMMFVGQAAASGPSRARQCVFFRPRCRTVPLLHPTHGSCPTLLLDPLCFGLPASPRSLRARPGRLPFRPAFPTVCSGISLALSFGGLAVRLRAPPDSRQESHEARSNVICRRGPPMAIRPVRLPVLPILALVGRAIVTVCLVQARVSFARTRRLALDLPWVLRASAWPVEFKDSVTTLLWPAASVT